MIDIIEEILGSYVPLNGDGIASLNFEWLLSAALWFLVVWFFFKLLLRLIDGNRGRK